MTQNKKYLNKIIADYNFSAHKNDQIVLSEENDCIKLELGGHWITKQYTKSPNDDDYERLLLSFFSFICNIACKNRPTYNNDIHGK